MLDSTDSQEDRLSRRRVRRWRRRARIAGPFLVVPAMLGLLVLSVDLIEYQPAGPATTRSPAKTAARPEPERATRMQAPHAALSVSVVEGPLQAAMGRTETAPQGPALPAWVGDSTDAESR